MIYPLSHLRSYFFSQYRDSSLSFRLAVLAFEVIGFVSLFFLLRSRRAASPPPGSGDLAFPLPNTKEKQREKELQERLELVETACANLKKELGAATARAETAEYRLLGPEEVPVVLEKLRASLALSEHQKTCREEEIRTLRKQNTELRQQVAMLETQLSILKRSDPARP